MNRVNPLVQGADMPLDMPTGGFAPVPVLSADPPNEFEGVSRYGMDISGFAQPFTDLLRRTAAQLRAEVIEFETAVAEIHEKLIADLDSFLLPRELFAAMPGEFMSVYGRKQGRPARAATWVPQAYHTVSNWLDITAAPAAVSVMRLLRGEINAPGVHRLADVDSLDDAQIAEVQSLLSDAPAGVPFVDKRIEFLDEGN